MAQSHGKSRRKINGRFPVVPFWMRSLGLIFICTTLLVFFMILRSRFSHSPNPRIHFVQDMDNQVKLKTQHTSDVFADGRASRPQILGTVAQSEASLAADDHYYRGYSSTWNAGANKFDIKYFDSMPKQLKVDEALLKRGQVKFNTYCMPCHGFDGRGVGPVAQVADQLQKDQVPGMSWTAPSNLTDADRVARVDGHIYNTIVNGIRNMGSYGAAIQDPADRWAIVAYVRALQLSASGAQASTAK